MDIHAIVSAGTMPELRGRVSDLMAGRLETSGLLEILFLLHRSEDTFWSAEAVAQRLRLRPETAAEILMDLTRAKLLIRSESTGAFRYGPSDQSMRDEIDVLAKTR